MSATEPAGDKIVRNLQQAVERLQADVSRVELLAGALGCFAKPIPEYGHGQSRFDLPRSEQPNSDRPIDDADPGAAHDSATQSQSGPNDRRLTERRLVDREWTAANPAAPKNSRLT